MSGAVLAGLLAASIGCGVSVGSKRVDHDLERAVPSHASASTPSARYVAVSVATVWTHPGAKRPVDAPALSNPAHPQQWVDNMTLAQKQWLSDTGAIQTQALYATPVQVLARSGSWTEVAVTTQPTPKNRLGYPGWVPSRQLTATPPAHTRQFVVVRRPTAWLWTGWGPAGVHGRRILQLSYDTRLPVLRVTPRYVEVVTLLGHHRAIRRAMVAVHTVRRGGQPGPPSSRRAAGFSD